MTPLPSMAAQTGVLRVLAVDYFGNQIDCEGAEARNLKTKKLFSLSLDGKACVKSTLPRGEYSVRFVAPSFPSRQQNVEINRPFTILQFALPFPYEGPPVRATLTGKVLNAGSKDVWVQLIGIFIPVNAYSYLDDFGRYKFSDLDPAKYFLCVLRDGRILHSKIVDVHAINEPLLITLPDDSTKH